jgi:hypothetical protein
MTFELVARKLQEELAEIIKSDRETDDYQLIVYKYVFISELGIPLWEDLGFEITDDSFMLYVIPDNLEFSLLRKLDDAFDRFNLSFMPNEYNVVKLKFELCD